MSSVASSRSVPSSPALSTHGEALEVHVAWGDTLLDAIELSPPRSFYLGDPAMTSLPIDLVVPGLEAPRVALVTVGEGGAVLHVPAGATSSAPDGTRLEQGLLHQVTIGALRLTVGLGERAARCPRTSLATEPRVLGCFAAAFAATGLFALSLAMFQPPLGLTDDEGADRDRAYLMMAYLDASAERERNEPPPTPGEQGGSEGAPLPEDGAKGESGKMGRRDATAVNRRASGLDPGDAPRAATTRAEDLQMAREFGLVGLLASGVAAPTHAPWEDRGVGDAALAGGFFGEIGEQAGVGGLGLSGIGEGGGFNGDRLGLGGIGTCGVGCGLGGNGNGLFGGSTGRSGPGHVAKAPQMRTGNTVVDGGSLPASVIQRVVRQNFGRFRSCYEDGLRSNPNLEGRVTARFVIARDGSVATVQSGGADLPDTRVVSCVLRTYGTLSFPAPTDGIVRVTYPLMFSPAA